MPYTVEGCIKAPGTVVPNGEILSPTPSGDTWPHLETFLASQLGLEHATGIQ